MSRIPLRDIAKFKDVTPGEVGGSMQKENVVEQYERRIQNRMKAGGDPLIPADHRVDWKDAPARFSLYSGLTRVPLSPGLNCAHLWLRDCQTAPVTSGQQRGSDEELSDFLLLSGGILGRKLTLNWTFDGLLSTTHLRSTYTRGPASGGGLYPVCVYIALGSQMKIPGVYHYDAAHHALTRLRLGDARLSVASAVDWPEGVSSDFWIVLTVNFWRTAFKYHNFAYQVATHDLGATLGSMQIVGDALAWKLTVVYWFRDRDVAELIGVDPDKEAAIAVIGVSMGHGAVVPKNSVCPNWKERPYSGVPRLRHDMYERSRRVVLPELIKRVHEETLLDEVNRPELSAARWHLGIPQLNREVAIGGNIVPILKRRETTWGIFRREPALAAEQLTRILEFVAHGSSYESDLYRCGAALPCLRMNVVIQHVTGFSSGVYEFDYTDSTLPFRAALPSASSLQSLFFLANHNLDQVAVVLVLIGRLTTVLHSLGSRGIRVMNAEAGTAAQRAYIASSALCLGCAAVLGFDGEQVSGILKLGKSEVPLLLVLLGHQCCRALAYDFGLT